MNRIITVGRQFGSGGRELGRRLAEELNIEYYDKEILEAIAKHTALSEEYIRQVVESKPHSLYPIRIGRSIPTVDDYHTKQIRTVYSAQNEIINSLADRSDCVIVGRCADYILRDRDPYRIFVYADIGSRIKRCMERSDETERFSEKEWQKKILKVDKNRKQYYEFYTGRNWGDISNYDLCINTSNRIIKDMIPSIAKLFIG